MSGDDKAVLAVWPVFNPYLQIWVMQELVERYSLLPAWRERRVRSELGGERLDVYASFEDGLETAQVANVSYANDLSVRAIETEQKLSLQLQVSKALQSKQRLQDEEHLMLQEAIRRHERTARIPADRIRMMSFSEEYRAELSAQLDKMPYLHMAIVGSPKEKGGRKFITKSQDGNWSSPWWLTKKDATYAERAKIANGFGFHARYHWGKIKAHIREVLLPRANQLLELAGVTRMLAEALARGQKVLVCGQYVFWYEESGGIGWQIKETASNSESERAALWTEGTILSKNHGRLVILPYIKDNGEKVQGHTKNGPHDGRAKPRHPDEYLTIPFVELDSDLMRGLFGELPYESVPAVTVYKGPQ